MLHSAGDFCMTLTAARYANWKAPPLDGQLLIWPSADVLLRETTENAKRLASADHVRVQGVPVSKLRKDIRAWLGHGESAAGDQPLIATGHQTELYHPGVWVKDAVINAVANRIGSSAYHFAVDTDQPKHLAVRWPASTLSITDDPQASTASWSGLLAAPTPEHLYDIESALASARAEWNFEPMLGEVLDSLRRSSLEPSGLSAAITSAQHELDWSLGLTHHAMLVSPMLLSPVYLIFVHHVLSQPAQFAADYNTALADYRAEAGISSNMRPMPDLRISTATVEVPFWLDNLADGSRARAEVRSSADGWTLSTGEAEFLLESDTEGYVAAGNLEKWLRDHQLRLSPRALTLTTFLRLLVVDQFVHGIGGGRYDQVTDRLLASHFKIDPPRFAVATGTLYFPGAVGQTRVCMPCVVQEGHRLKHGLLGEKKREMIRQIDALPRRSVQRSLAFHSMHGALAAVSVDHPALAEWSARLDFTAKKQREEQVLFDRELFYAMQTRDRLSAMIQQANAAFLPA
jgi:hypothetical protein